METAHETEEKDAQSYTRDKEKRRYSAGILPYAIYKNEVYFLVGRDWRDEGWSDFGGKMEQSDNYDVKTTAVREFYEETVGCVQTIENVSKWLQGQNYQEILSKTLNGSPYYMYLVEVPYLNYRHVFHKMIQFLRYSKCDTHKFYEKNDIRWIPLHLLFEHQGSVSPGYVQFKLRHVFKKTIDEHSSILKGLQSNILRKNDSKDIFTYD